MSTLSTILENLFAWLSSLLSSFWTPLFSIFVLKCEVEEASSPSYGVVIRWMSRRWLLLFLSIVRLDWWWFCWHPCPLIISCSKFWPLNCLYKATPLPLNEIIPTLGCIGLCQPILSAYQSICTKMANDEHRRIHTPVFLKSRYYFWSQKTISCPLLSTRKALGRVICICRGEKSLETALNQRV